MTVEVLEGARPVRQVPVAALADEPVGLGVYMDVSALHRLMREGDTISGAYLKVDSRSRAQTVLGLEAHSFHQRRGRARSHARQLLEDIWRFHLDLYGIPGRLRSVIAFGVVYNGARIALSERGNELACLRVLGYTRAEIGRILLGEQGLLTLASIPAGFALGFGLSLLLSRFFSRDLFRLPLVVNAGTYAFAAIVVLAAAIFSGLVVAQRLRHMDLTEVLKSRE